MPAAHASKSSRECLFDFPGVRIGCAEYPEGPTGCTVIDLPADSLVTVDIRGGSPAVWMGLDGDVNAIAFAGGSLYGLEAVAGVTHAIRESWGPMTFPLDPSDIPVVRGAAIFDFRLGHDIEIVLIGLFENSLFEMFRPGGFTTRLFRS
jgi:6-aminohexanoate-oligomer endohydrolase